MSKCFFFVLVVFYFWIVNVYSRLFQVVVVPITPPLSLS
jgi:hypothetical protein